MKSFEVHFRYRDRNEETVQSKLKVEASSLPGGIAKATREFVKSLDRKQRFDMNKNGLAIRIIQSRRLVHPKKLREHRLNHPPIADRTFQSDSNSHGCLRVCRSGCPPVLNFAPRSEGTRRTSVWGFC
jgi:hypothetical protein